MTQKEIIKIIKDMDAKEADAMGASCQYFAFELIKEIKSKDHS